MNKKQIIGKRRVQKPQHLKESQEKSKDIHAAPLSPKIKETEVDIIDSEDTHEKEEVQTLSLSSPDGANGAALASASTTTDASTSFKSFRHHPDMENFYRFIYENDLRHEALTILDEVLTQKQNKKLIKLSKVQAH
ncbi:MAG: hypothetical protein HY072_08975 [Deltaproteobacteria bacterium]|nr:hypothetical protein [Deltaproteobacteria bacterium]